jgi:hypothetical protein
VIIAAHPAIFRWVTDLNGIGPSGATQRCHRRDRDAESMAAVGDRFPQANTYISRGLGAQFREVFFYRHTKPQDHQ